MRYRLTGARGVIERVERLLGERDDDDAAQLLCAVKVHLREVTRLVAEEQPDEEASRAALSETYDLLARVRGYAEACRLDWLSVQTPPPPSNEKVALRVDHLRELIDAMPVGATSPPAEVADQIEEAQLAGRHSTLPSPPPELDDFEQTTRPKR